MTDLRGHGPAARPDRVRARTLVWIDASGPVRVEPIPGDDWRGGFRGAPAGFLRAEVVAEASRPGILDAFLRAVGERPLPEGLTPDDLASHPVRRALSNPIYVED